MKDRASVFTNLSVDPNFPNPEKSITPKIVLSKDDLWVFPLRVMVKKSNSALSCSDDKSVSAPYATSDRAFFVGGG